MGKPRFLVSLVAFVWMMVAAAPSAHASTAVEETLGQVAALEQQQQSSPQLEAALQAIAATGVPELTQIVDAVRSQGANLRFDDEVTLAPACALNGAWALYAPPRVATLCGLQRSPYIVLSSSLRRYPDGSLTPPKSLATLLVHEGYHLREDLVLNSPSRDSFSCLAHELHAESSVGLYWDTIWPAGQYPNGMPNPQIDLEKEYNALLQAFRSGDPDVVGRDIAIILSQYYSKENAPCRPSGQSGIPGANGSRIPSPPNGQIPNGYSSMTSQPSRSGSAPIPGAAPCSNGTDTSTAPSGGNPVRNDQCGSSTPLERLSGFLNSIAHRIGDNVRSSEGGGRP